MNCDPEYLKMVLALPEDFFENWKWQVGDKQVLQCKSGKLYHKLVCEEDVGTVYIDTNYSYLDCSQARMRPIPSQEQLQKMLKSNILTDAGNLWHVFCTFDEFVHSEYERRSFLKTGKLISDSFEMLWLSCVMKTKYNQIWDGNVWADEEK